MPENEGRNGRTGGPREWPDDVDGGTLLKFAGYFWDLKRSLTSASFGWDEAGPDERAAYLDELQKLRDKEAIAWATHIARPVTTKGTP